MLQEPKIPHRHVTVHDVQGVLVVRQRVEGEGEVHQRLHEGDELRLELPLHGDHQLSQQTLDDVDDG